MHIAAGICNQDSVFSGETDSIDYAAVADGVSACRNSKEGADFVVNLAFEVMDSDCDYIFEVGEKKAACLLTEYFQRKLKEKAENENDLPETYSSTISFVCRHKKTGKVMSFILGDSNIYGVRGNALEKLTSSDEVFGMCCSTMTAGAVSQAKVSFMDENDYSGFFISTDGAWKIIFGNEEKNEKLKEMIIDENMLMLSQALEQENNTDDCSYAFLKTVSL